MESSKLLLPVDGAPLLGQLLSRLVAAGVTEVYIVSGYKHEDVQHYVNSVRERLSGADIMVIRDRGQPGTQEALRVVHPFLDDREFVILDAATLLSPTYLAHFGSGDVAEVSVGLTRRTEVAWHHSLAAVGTGDVIRRWWLETEPPASITTAECYGRNMGILKVGPSWWSLTGDSTAHALRRAVNDKVLGDVFAVWDDGSFRHFGTPREYGIFEPNQLMYR